MRVGIAADHAGFLLKQQLVPLLESLHHEVIDLGTHSGAEPDDYPDYALALGRLLAEGRADRGILICGSGVGASVAANKIPGIRAGLCHDTYSAHQGVEHDNINVLVLGARIIGNALAGELVESFLKATFSGEERHRRRLAKVMEIEAKGLQAGANKSGSESSRKV
ncbi:MAG TPA: ribose 5-phosphate isomerase B [Bryobacteraceae bacterium]|nr:ribose 5-phosphate isomerase B [Bryobacteraceae bacterium]HOL73772.1 ribose 5-phosphate isomerase B [Bryobacteraceae bacterium]HOQ45653.1 ribose 5-phosphate isomerase B [Bryobacteraceae bacterium]HPU71621.1 ribose 5-phosphate isomerase B [Bryobacteraceae bacterium]